MTVYLIASYRPRNRQHHHSLKLIELMLYKWLREFIQISILLLIGSLMSSFSTQAIDDNSQCTNNIQHIIHSIATVSYPTLFMSKRPYNVTNMVHSILGIKHVT